MQSGCLSVSGYRVVNESGKLESQGISVGCLKNSGKSRKFLEWKKNSTGKTWKWPVWFF